MHLLLAALERQTLKVKLIFGFISLLLIILGIGLDSLHNQTILNDSIQLIHDKGMMGLSKAKDAQLNYTLIGRTLRQAIIATDAEGRELALKQLSQVRSQLPKNIDDIRTRLIQDENQTSLAHYEEALAAYMREVDKALLLLNANQIPEAQILVASHKFQDVGIHATAKLTQMIQIKEQAAKEVAQKAQHIAQHGLWLTGLLVTSGLLSGILCGILVGHSIRRPLNHIRDAVVVLSQGHLDHPIPHADAPNELGELARAITVLQTEARQMETQRWIKSHSAEISGALQMASTMPDLAQKFFSKTAPVIQLGHGAFYLWDETSQQLHLLAGYAHLNQPNPQTSIAIGQGLVGQCAREQQLIILHNPPAEYIRIQSGLGTSPPRSIVIIPILRNRQLLAVVELATLTPYNNDKQSLLDHLLPILAVSLEILDRSNKTARLLEETQSQAAKLEEQTIELAARQQRIIVTEAWYRGIIESAPDGMLVLDAAGHITLTNPRIEMMFGYSSSELIHHSITTLMPDLTSWEQLMEKEKSTNRERYAIHKEGASIPLEYAITPMFQNDRLIGTVVVLRDITLRKQTEMALRDQSAFQQALIDTIPYPVFYKGADTRFLGFNRAYEETFAVHRQDLIGKRVLDLEYLPEADRIAYQNEDEMVIHQATSVQREMPIPFADGKMHDTLYFVSGFRRADGTPGGLVGTFIDVSDRKKVEDLERLTLLTVKHEAHITELKREINALAAQLHHPTLSDLP
ncbi:MAG: PAS domain S-box protein [Magnetococcales bacterium]|nr:PAS domain S-box protein [Magnetococcales bacterium]NGZ04892.1 PAS domain S-box protein [Magnetococcales bacterium]